MLVDQVQETLVSSNRMMLNNTFGTARIEDADETIINEPKGYSDNARVTATFNQPHSETEYLIDPESSVGMLILKPRPDVSNGLNSVPLDRRSNPQRFVLHEQNVPKDSHLY